MNPSESAQGDTVESETKTYCANAMYGIIIDPFCELKISDLRRAINDKDVATADISVNPAKGVESAQP